ncbi:MAG: tRNA pseudouridine(55) synthase TruB [Burkholderiales bacterium]|nr:tRNA pseudouridine(55) synthase TruB [Phycisphaerae bacterium]
MFNGVLNLDKDPGLSSNAVLTRIKYLLPRHTKVGHAGTLDPFATGVLLVLIGKATKQFAHFAGTAKQYVATIKLGATTATDDLDSPAVEVAGAAAPARDAIVSALEMQTGNILQRPSTFSALKLGGMRACDRIRLGETIDLPSRPVHIHMIELLDYAWPLLTICVDCGRGTYIRAIARDVGTALNVGGYLTALRRTKVGEFRIADSVRLTDLSSHNIGSRLVDIAVPAQPVITHQ